MAVHTYTRSKTGDTVYTAVYFAPDGRRRKQKVCVVPADASKKDHDRARAEAVVVASRQRCAVENETWIEPKAAKPRRLKVKNLLKLWLKNHTTDSGSMAYWEDRVKTWNRYLGSKPADLPQKYADRFNVDRRKDVSLSTVRKDLCGFSSVYDWAQQRGLVRSNPFHPKTIKRPRKPKPKPNPLSHVESKALLLALPDWLRPVAEFCIETGVDKGEALALTWDKVDRDRKRITLPRGKTDVGRVIPYRDNARVLALLAAAGKAKNYSGVVFLKPDDDGKPRPIHTDAAGSTMRRAWCRVFQCRCQDRQKGHTAHQACPTRAKAKPWKSLRATFCTRAIEERNLPIPVVAGLMGLTSSHVFEHY